MLGDVRRLVAKIAQKFKRKFYGRTFRCPVCHVELAMVDADGNRLMVCPVCGVVLDVEEVYGHVVPVVLEVELHRPQPKMRIHPLMTHAPIGLFPFAVLGTVALILASVLGPRGTPGARAGVVARQRSHGGRCDPRPARVVGGPFGSYICLRAVGLEAPVPGTAIPADHAQNRVLGVVSVARRNRDRAPRLGFRLFRIYRAGRCRVADGPRAGGGRAHRSPPWHDRDRDPRTHRRNPGLRSLIAPFLVRHRELGKRRSAEGAIDP